MPLYLMLLYSMPMPLLMKAAVPEPEEARAARARGDPEIRSACQGGDSGGDGGVAESRDEPPHGRLVLTPNIFCGTVFCATVFCAIVFCRRHSGWVVRNTHLPPSRARNLLWLIEIRIDVCWIHLSNSVTVTVTQLQLNCILCPCNLRHCIS